MAAHDGSATLRKRRSIAWVSTIAEPQQPKGSPTFENACEVHLSLKKVTTVQPSAKHVFRSASRNSIGSVQNSWILYLSRRTFSFTTAKSRWMEQLKGRVFAPSTSRQSSARNHSTQFAISLLAWLKRMNRRESLAPPSTALKYIYITPLIINRH
jgi:hypothetical protein